MPSAPRNRDEFARLRDTIAALREPDGCPWDREQTLSDVARYVVEEACEVADAVDEGHGSASASVREELGDVMMTLLLAARIAEEEGGFSTDDVLRGVREKLVRRHPHVFTEARLGSSAEVVRQWEEIKAAEREEGHREEPKSRLDGVPRSLPPLARAQKISSRAARAGFDWVDAAGCLKKLREEVGEVEEILEAPAETEAEAEANRKARIEEELGDVLFTAVNLCRKLAVRSESALRAATAKFSRRFRGLEDRFAQLENQSPRALNAAWDEIRSGERGPRAPGGASPRDRKDPDPRRTRA